MEAIFPFGKRKTLRIRGVGRTVHDDAFFEPRLCRIAHEEEDVNESDQTDLPLPAFTVDEYFPGMNVAARVSVTQTDERFIHSRVENS